MKEKKELTSIKAIISIIICYFIFTILFGAVYSLVMSAIASFLPNMVNIILAVVISILMMFFAWKLSIIVTLKNKDCDGLETKKIVKVLVIFLVIMSVISTVYDLYNTKVNIENQYSNSFLEDRDIQDAFTPEELQERANQNDTDKAEAKKYSYSLIITENVLSLIINLLIFSLVPKKALEKYDGVKEMEKNISKE